MKFALLLAIPLALAAQPFPGQHGLGTSSITCVDRDGDGYGTGAQRVGPFYDLVIDGSNAKKVTSASYSFVQTDVASSFHVTAGTGFTVGLYTIDSVSAGAAIMTANVGTTSSTGGSYTRPGCLGVDSDDQDYTIHTGPEIVAKYGSLTAALAHLGYNPLRQWFVATGGNDTTCISGGAPVGIGSPCLTPAPMTSNCLPGDALIYRAGVYDTSQLYYPRGGCNGTSAHHISVLTYPGETVIIDTHLTTQPPIDLLDNQYVDVDGFKLTGSDGGCVNGGTPAWFGPIDYTNITVRHIEGWGCRWVYAAFGFTDILFEDSVGHDNLSNSPIAREHTVYWGAYGAQSSNGTIRRIIAYNNERNGIHINGDVTNLLEEQNLAYNNLVANFDHQNGTHNSIFRSNLSFQGGDSGGLIYFVYPGNEGTSTCGMSGMDPCVCTPTPTLNALCAHDQTGNVIENFTHVQGQKKVDGSAVNPVAIQIARSPLCDGSTPACLVADQGSNTFRNLIVTTYNTGIASYPPSPIWYPNASTGWPQSSTFNSIVSYQTDATHAPEVILYGPTNAYTCGNAGSVSITLTNCVNADPKLASSNSTWYLTPNLFDFRLATSSPAIHSGTATGAPTYDVLGNPVSATPSMGSQEVIKATWTDLGSGSQLIAAAPQNCNNSGPTYCTANGGVIYDYHDNFHNRLTAWPTCLARTKSGSEQFVCPSGGHTDYVGNDVSAINMSVNPVTVSRLSDPSVPTGSSTPATVSNFTCDQPNADGSALSYHGYQLYAEIPGFDEMFLWTQGASDFCLGWPMASMDRMTFTYSLASHAWANMAPGGFNVQAGSSSGAYASNIVFDPTTTHKTLLAMWGLGNFIRLLRYDRDANTWASLLSSSAITWPSGGYAAIDPVRKILVSLGADYQGMGALNAVKVDISGSTYPITDITSTLSGCSAADVLAPGVSYDHTTGTFKIYPGSGNDVLDFNPETGACITITASGGPTDPAPMNGEWGKWQGFPTLGKFVEASLVTSNAFSWNVNVPNVTSLNGIGGKAVIGGNGSFR